MRNRCVKEEDILLLCKFEKKQFRAIINGLKNEKILLTKVRLEPTPNCEPDPETGKQQTTKFTYFHIDYRGVGNQLLLSTSKVFSNQKISYFLIDYHPESF